MPTKAENSAVLIAALNRESAEITSYKLSEAKSEIARHHKDFEAISDICDEFFKKEPSYEAALKALKAIRNIVG